MKKILIIVMAVAILFVVPACNYNGKATVIVKNIGTLTVSVSIEYNSIYLAPGASEEFTLTWPGHDDMHSNIASYAVAYKETLWNSISFWIGDGETKTFEIEFHAPESSE